MDWLTSFILSIYFLLVIGLMIRVIFNKKSIGSTLAWLFLLFFLPGIGFGLYLLLGERFIGYARANRARDIYEQYSIWIQRQSNHPNAIPFDSHAQDSAIWKQSFGTLRMPAFDGNQVRLLSDPESILSSIERSIREARNSVTAEFYICQPGGRVEQILDAMVDAVKRGVEVRLILDSVGSRSFLKSQKRQALEAAGVQVLSAMYTNPVEHLWQRIDIRLHRKIISIDGTHGFLGSMNLVDPELFKSDAGVGQWIDLMLCISGPTAKVLQGVMLADWEMETGERLEHLSNAPSECEKPGVEIQILPSGPPINSESLLQLLLCALYNARHSINITTPYFAPDETLILALKAAAQRGVKVKLFLPRHNDSRLAQYAGRAAYEELMLSGVEIHRFRGGLLHSKCVTVDEHTVLIGTVNLDMRSIWLNFEVTAVVKNNAFCQSVKQVIKAYEKQSQQLMASEWRKRRNIKKIAENFARLLSPLL